MKIQSLTAREILDSSGNPTVEAEVVLSNGASGIGSVPAGTSTGSAEAFELRDNDLSRYGGLGVRQAVENINTRLAHDLETEEINFQADLDRKLITLDGTENKSSLGANAILAVSIAFAQAQANWRNLPLFESLRQEFEVSAGDIIKKIADINALPKPMMVLIEGGKHASSSSDFQEYLIKPDDVVGTAEQIRACQEVRLKLAEILKSTGYPTGVGLEGGFAPNILANNEKPLDLLTAAIQSAGYEPKQQLSIGIDVAASTLFQDAHYHLKTNSSSLTPGEMIEYIGSLCQRYPVTSIEDGLAEDDPGSWPSLFHVLEELSVLTVGDDLTVTNPTKIANYAQNSSINGVVIKMNQIGTITETVSAILTAKEYKLKTIVSHRGAETTDTTLVDLAVAFGADYIKVGPTRGERVVKYNRLMKIEELTNTK